jgi:hypothetical protein
MSLIDRFLEGLAAKMEDPVDSTYMAVVIPGDLDPFDRHYRLSIHLDAELRLAGCGCTSGGGTLWQNVNFDDPDDDSGEVVSTILDVEATDVDKAREVLRLHLPELGAPEDTRIRHGAFEDRFDGERWHLNEPDSSKEN